MKSTRPLFFSLIALVGLAVAFYPRPEPGNKEAIQLSAMMEGLRQYHFMPRQIDDEFSLDVYNQFLENMDAGKRFFTASDIEALAPYRYQIDDQINGRNFEFFNRTTERFDEAVDKTHEWYKEILANPLNFQIEENLETDAEKLDWARSDNALKERWRMQLKYEVLTRLTDKLDAKAEGDEDYTDKTYEEMEAEAREAVLERYEDWYERMDKTETDEYYSEYLTTIANVFDPHTSYFEPVQKQNFDISMSGKLEGIGARLQTDREDTKIVSIVPGGPAWKQKELEVNDLIIKVAQADEEPVVVTGMDINDVVSLIRGDKGTEVRLTVRKVDGSLKVISIIRDEVILDEGFAKSLIINPPGGSERIGYIRLPRFYADFESRQGRSCATDVAKELEKLKNEDVDGIIVDLRGNGGGSLRDVVKMTGYFIEQGPIVQVKTKAGRASVHEDRDSQVQWDGELIVMVNEFSASASEIMAAALQDYDRAVIVGSPSTYGKGTVQRFFDLDNAVNGADHLKPLGQVKLTIQKFYRVHGGSTQLLGVTPDIILPDNYSELEIGEKDYDFAMPFTEIDGVRHEQQVQRVSPILSELQRRSADRVGASTAFQKTAENAARFKAQREQTVYPLKLDFFQTYMKERREEADRYKDLYSPNPDLQVMNPGADIAYIQADSSRIARNDDFLEQVQKDMYIDETLAIMADMLELNRELAGTKKESFK